MGNNHIAALATACLIIQIFSQPSLASDENEKKSFAKRAMASHKKLSEKILADRYQIIKVLGEGGFGVVYHAYDQTLQIDVAIKTLQADSQGLALVRLQREASEQRISFDYFG